MKKSSLIASALVLSLCLLCGCGNSKNASASASTSTDIEVVDITGLSETMAYAQMYNMAEDPETYDGTPIILTGYYDNYENTTKNEVYHALVIVDTLGCCSMAFEVIFDDSYVYPDDFPDTGTLVTLETTFETNGLDEDTGYYVTYHLVDAVFVE